MKQLLKRLNWKNFLQRTLLFFFVFLIIRMLVDVVEKDFSFNRIIQQSIIRYFIFAMVLGILDSETWLNNKVDDANDKAQEFKSIRAAILHYIGVAFFISILCGLILTVFFAVRFIINSLGNNKPIAFFPDWNVYLMVIAVIGICFACYDAFRNNRSVKKDNNTTE
jgi:mannose/fructose/N-acetylgalactosamine-specific phosphotransferase system component IIC